MATESQTAHVETVQIAQKSARQKQIILIVSRVWAWVFLATLVLFFYFSALAQSGGP